MYGELLFGNIAIQLRYATQGQIQSAVDKQNEKYQDLPLGEILVKMEIISPEQCDEIVEIQYQNPVPAAKCKFGKLALLNGFVTQKNLMKSVEYQKQYLKRKGKLPNIGKILLKQQMVSQQQVNAILTLQSRLKQQSRPPSHDGSTGVLEISDDWDLDESERERITASDFKIDDNERSCPACSTIIYKDLTFCPQCKVLFCQLCSGELDVDQRFCLSCGEFVQGQAPKKYKKIERYSDSAMQVAYVFLAIGILISGYLIKSAFFSPPPPVRIVVSSVGELDIIIGEFEEFIIAKKLPEANKMISKYRTTMAAKKSDMNDPTKRNYEIELDTLMAAYDLANKQMLDASKATDTEKEPDEDGPKTRKLSYDELQVKVQNQFSREQYKEAYFSIKELLKREEKTWKTYVIAGETAIKLKKIEEAVRYFEIAKESSKGKNLGKEFDKIYEKLIVLYQKANNPTKLTILLEQLSSRNDEQKKLLAHSYWKIDQREKCWDIYLNYKDEKDLLIQNLLAEYAMKNNKTELMESIIKKVEAIDSRFLNLRLWRKWVEVFGSKIIFLKIKTTNGREVSGKVIKETKSYYKLENLEDGRKMTVTFDKIAKKEKIPNPDLVELKAFLNERIQINYGASRDWLLFGKKHIKSTLLKPFAIAELTRIVDDKQEALELLFDNNYFYKREEKVVIEQQFAEIQDTIKVMNNRAFMDSKDILLQLFEKYPNDPYLSYFNTITMMKRHQKDCLESIPKIPEKERFKKLRQLEFQITAVFQTNCRSCRGVGERCDVCKTHATISQKCKVCLGSRKDPKDKKKKRLCPNCKGVGVLRVTCPGCKGKKYNKKCSNCGKLRDVPVPDVKQYNEFWFVKEELVEFFEKGKIVSDNLFKVPAIDF